MRIGLLYGGISNEKEISISSADSIYKSLYKKIDIHRIEFSGDYSSLLNIIKKSEIDVILNSLHGGDGEDGKMQKFFEDNNIRYTGSNSISSGIAMDKNLTKIKCHENRIPTPDWIFYDSKNIIDYKMIFEKFDSSCVVKPSNEGSSIGMYIINLDKSNSLENLKEAISKSFKVSDKIIIEQFIDGKELTASILGEDVLPIIEIVPKNNLYDYASKYTKGMTNYIVPAKINSDIEKEVCVYAMQLHKIVGCRHYSRVDFRLDDNGKLYVLEINTLPGMTSTSLFPKAAEKINISYSELIEQIINRALND